MFREVTLQLAALCPVFTKNLWSLRLDIECSEQLLVCMLSLVPALECLELARPNALSTTFFQAFVVREPNVDCASDMAGPSSQAIAPLCPSMGSLNLHYRKWLRRRDKRALIKAFGDIVASRNPERRATFTLSLQLHAPEPDELVPSVARRGIGAGQSSKCGSKGYLKTLRDREMGGNDLDWEEYKIE